jgi:hypothetical protein
MMNLEALSDTALLVCQTQIGGDAAEGLREDSDGAAMVISLGVARPLHRRHAAFYPVGTNPR